MSIILEIRRKEELEASAANLLDNRNNINQRNITSTVSAEASLPLSDTRPVWFPSGKKFGFSRQFLDLVGCLAEKGPVWNSELVQFFPGKSTTFCQTVQSNWIKDYLAQCDKPDAYRKLLKKYPVEVSQKRPKLYIATELTKTDLQFSNLPVDPYEAKSICELFGQIPAPPRVLVTENGKTRKTFDACMATLRLTGNQLLCAAQLKSFLNILERENFSWPSSRDMLFHNIYLTAKHHSHLKAFNFAGQVFICRRDAPVRYIFEPPSAELQRLGAEFFTTLRSVDGMPFECFDDAFATIDKSKSARRARVHIALPDPITVPVLQRGSLVQYNSCFYTVDTAVYFASKNNCVVPVAPIAQWTCVPVDGASWLDRLREVSPCSVARSFVYFADNLYDPATQQTFAGLLIDHHIPAKAPVSLVEVAESTMVFPHSEIDFASAEFLGTF